MLSTFIPLLILFHFELTSGLPTRKCFVQTPLFRGSSSECSGELKSLSQVANTPSPEGEDFGASNMADLIMTRGAVYDSNERKLENIYLCVKHENEFGAGWTKITRNRPPRIIGGRHVLKCNMPDIEGLRPHTVVSARQRTFLAKGQSKALWMQKNIFVPLGTAMCERHAEFIQGLTDANKVEERNEETEEATEEQPSTSRGTGRVVGPYVLRQCQPQSYLQTPPRRGWWRQAGASGGVCSAGARSQASSGSQGFLSQEPCDKVKRGVRDIACAVGIPEDQVHFSAVFASLAPPTKVKRANVAKKVTNAVMSSFAPDAPNELLEMVTEKEGSGGLWQRRKTAQFLSWIENVVEEYAMGPTRQIRLQTLSTIAPVLSYNELANYIPGLTRYSYKEARRYAKRLKAGFIQPQIISRRERYNKVKVETFIGFITSSMVVSDMPFGHVTVRRSSGEKHELPNLIRNTVNQRIIEQYKTWLADRGRLDLLLSDSTLWRILKSCKAITRKSLLGLDYFTYEGVEGISSLIDLVSEIKAVDGDADWAKDITRVLRHTKIFFKTDYKTYIQYNSDISDYSRQYALSDPSDRVLQADTSARPERMRRCAQCVAMLKAFKEIAEKIDTVAWPDEKDRKEAEFIFGKSKSAILEWQKHVMRTVHQNEAKEEILQNLKGDEAWVLMDWAMKFIPKKGTESQAEWYGKRGISWHISVAYIRKPATNQFYHRTYVHIFDPDTLHRMKAELPALKKVYLRSDNAGCYHSGQTLAALPLISEKTGVQIMRYDFSDPQSGKGACDRATSVIKRHVKIYIDENHKCSTPAEFLECASSHGGVKTATFIHAGLDAPKEKTGKGSIPGVTSLHNFEFTGANRIRAWNAYKIGAGKMLTTPTRTQPLPRLHPVHSASTSGSKHMHPLRTSAHWMELTSKSIPLSQRQQPVSARDDGWVPDEDEESDASTSSQSRGTTPDDPDALEGQHRQRLYPCDEEGCTKMFQTYHNWYRHVSVGKHTYRKERLSLRDFSINTYVEKIERSQLFSDSPAAADAIRTQRDQDAVTELDDPLPMGWALKVRRETKRFTAAQKAYLTDKFNEGAQTGIKYNPHDVAKLMRRDRRFPDKEHWLTWTQIASFWSRLSRDRERSEQQGSSSSATPVEGSEEYDLEEIIDNEYANAYSEHIEESIRAVIDEAMEKD